MHLKDGDVGSSRTPCRLGLRLHLQPEAQYAASEHAPCRRVRPAAAGAVRGHPWVQALAERLRAFGGRLVLSAGFVAVPFFFALGKLVIRGAKRWERERLLVGSGSSGWLQDVMARWVGALCLLCPVGLLGSPRCAVSA